MKKIMCFAVLAFTTAAFAQNKTVEFVKKYKYQIEVLDAGKGIYDQGEYDKVAYDHYVSKNNKEGLLSFYYTENAVNAYSGESNFYMKNNWIIPITVNGLSKTTSYTEYSASNVIDEGSSLTKLDRKGVINGLSCQYYAILNDAANKDSYTYCFCIDESNKQNNAESIFPESKVKGLVLSLETSDPYYRLVYKSSETANVKLDLDGDKIIADIKTYKENEATDYATAVDSVATYPYGEGAENIYADPLYSYTNGNGELTDYNLYNYFSPIYSITSTALYNTKEYSTEGTIKRENLAKFFEKESKSLVKNLASSKVIDANQKKELQKFFKEQVKSVKEYKPGKVSEDYATAAVVATDYATAADDATYATDSYDYYTKYQSAYNDIKVEDKISLAYDLDTENNDAVKQYAPDYCDDLQKKIPNFQSKELKKHVHNLTGQICDLYLYNNGGNVDYFGTINQMRKSYLEIEKLRSSLSQKDQKSLLEFLKSLD